MKKRLEKLVKPPKGMVLDDWSLAIGTFDATQYFSEWACYNFGYLPTTVWSCPETAGRMDDPIPGDFRSLLYTHHWGDVEVRMYLFPGITWGELWMKADEAVRSSGDSHHIYIESFEIDGNTLILQTGS